MCKVLVLTNTAKIKNPRTAIRVIASHVTRNDRDGFGYAIQGDKGVFGERTTVPKGFTPAFKSEVLDLPFLRPIYNRFGQWGKLTGAGIFHGRTSTNDGTLRNTHPIVKHDWTLIHNGVVTNHGPGYERITTNDTEHLVHYMAHGGVDALARNLTGYYAAAAFSPDGALHVFRDDRATLHFGYISALDSFIIGTTAQLVRDICTEMQWSVSFVSPVNDCTYLVFKDGKLASNTTFTPRGATDRENRYAHLSLKETGSATATTVTRSSYPAGPAASTTVDLLSVDDAELSELDGDLVLYNRHGYTDDEVSFLEEVSVMDAGYTVLDSREDVIATDDFFNMSADEQLACTVIRPDGTVADPADYSTERVYRGRVS